MPLAHSWLAQGTGLNNVLWEVYGENAAVHMMSGKAVQRAFRGHLLVNKCLNKMIVTEKVDEQPELNLLVSEAEDIYASLVKGETTMDSAKISEPLTQLATAIDKKKAGLRERSKTSQLWLNYQEMMNVSTSLFKSDRAGNWQMHLRAVPDCLPIFATAGYFNYLKSAYYYVQEIISTGMPCYSSHQ